VVLAEDTGLVRDPQEVAASSLRCHDRVNV